MTTRAAVPAVLFALAAALGTGAAEARLPADPALVRTLRRCDGLLSAWHADSAVTVLDSMRAAPAASADRNLRMEIELRRAACYGLTGRALDAEQAARSGLTLAESLGDSLGVRLGLRWLAYSYLIRTRLEVATPLYQRLLTLSIAAGDARDEGYSRGAIAYRDLLAGRLEPAREGYRLAIACLARAGDSRAMLVPMVGLARAECDLGDYPAARRGYAAIIALAREVNDRTSEADALNNLGALEYGVGDPAVAVRRWRDAIALYQRAGARASMHSSSVNIAIAEADLGHADDAVAELERLLALAERDDDLRGQGQALLELAALRGEQGRYPEVIRLMRRCLALGSAPAPSVAAFAGFGMSEALAAMDRREEALALLTREVGPLRSRLSASVRVRLDLELGHLLLELDRPAEALAHFVAARAAASVLHSGLDLIDAGTGAGRCEARLGHAELALATLRDAQRVWETERRVPSEPEWRVRRGRLAEGLCFALARAMLGPDPERADPARVRDTYDMLQRFKARTLLERMVGPSLAPERTPEPVTAAALQSGVLHADELLIDLFMGSEDVLVFALDRDTLRLARVASAESLAAAVRLYHDLLVCRPSNPALDVMRDRASRRIADELFAPLAGELGRCRRVILAPDGLLNELPFGELPLPAGGRTDATCWLDRHEVTRVPSATLLATLRGRPLASAGHALLALGGASDERGRRLPGAAEEVRALGRDYEDVDVRLHQPGDPLRVSPFELRHYRVLHLAAHTLLDDQRPWNSGVQLGPLVAGADTTTSDPYLRAGSIAAMRLPARLAVLSGCASGAGRVAWGEGVEGLSAAFLSAGVPAVVATLWPVDDAASATLTRAFYAGLARGETAAEALRHAQRHVAAERATAHPFYWAGYVLVGDGEVRIPLRRRLPGGPIAIAGAGLAVIGVWSWRTRRPSGAPTRTDRL